MFDISGPEDLRSLALQDLENLAEDLRQKIVSVVLQNGGHLGASLGAVELAIALHGSFKSPEEPIIWDVGHQAYAHKILTGRWKSFETLRQRSGLSGFPSRAESHHDVFGTGHSSTALSAALAMAWARRSSEDWTVAVMGDGGMSAGLAFEALNNIKSLELGNLLVVLNDNHLSISKSVGGLAEIFSGDAAGFFDSLGIQYEGPIDGNNLEAVLSAIAAIKESAPTRPVLLHAYTEKGRGYAPAEKLPGAFHGVSAVRAQGSETITYSEEFGRALCAIAANDSRVVAITAAMTEGTGLAEFARKHPDRLFDVGIAEQHAVTFAAGLATQGYKPVVAVYSTFLQRALDSVIHDVALQNLGVVFAVDRGGLVGPDGATHHGVFDLAYLGMIPGLRVYAPACRSDLSELLSRALNADGPVAIRYPRGPSEQEYEPLIGASMRVLRSSMDPRLIVVALGVTGAAALQAVNEMDWDGSRVAVVNVVQAKPFPPELLDLLRRHPDASIVTVEAGVIRGGFGESLAAEIGQRGKWYFSGVPDRFLSHGTTGELEDEAGISAASLSRKLREICEKAN